MHAVAASHPVYRLNASQMQLFDARMRSLHLILHEGCIHALQMQLRPCVSRAAANMYFAGLELLQTSHMPGA